ncbi:YkoF family thiamine/hydroxymethylpyrimidine-binding protein [Neolewinella agarilytica]|uniref:YKOF-related Family n=1 Tax=Neolewinella agarilytica TaxID=478744 RepID=A0A1H9MHL7_9BACT|nr:YkoF family thiamine/hydroxymethylpyrimidine-binding protein [Neolewinella agarilytica]SER23148.1 YKOF-related Family [Neolewinella agarilytica]
MKTSAELSLYPLTKDYEEPIIAFIKLLQEQPDIKVATNGLSTQLTGEYDAVMKALTLAMKPSMAESTTCSFVIKLLNVAISPGEKVAV